MTPVEFRGDLWHQKNRVPGLSCGVVSVILRLAVLVEHRLVTDRRTDRQTQGHSIASRGKNQHTKYLDPISYYLLLHQHTQTLDRLLYVDHWSGR